VIGNVADRVADHDHVHDHVEVHDRDVVSRCRAVRSALRAPEGRC
jgi:hypothetical protein